MIVRIAGYIRPTASRKTAGRTNRPPCIFSPARALEERGEEEDQAEDRAEDQDREEHQEELAPDALCTEQGIREGGYHAAERAGHHCLDLRGVSRGEEETGWGGAGPPHPVSVGLGQDFGQDCSM